MRKKQVNLNEVECVAMLKCKFDDSKILVHNAQKCIISHNNFQNHFNFDDGSLGRAPVCQNIYHCT